MPTGSCLTRRILLGSIKPPGSDRLFAVLRVEKSRNRIPFTAMFLWIPTTVLELGWTDRPDQLLTS